jgi:hypothetical protein
MGLSGRRKEMRKERRGIKRDVEGCITFKNLAPRLLSCIVSV